MFFLFFSKSFEKRKKIKWKLFLIKKIFKHTFRSFKTRKGRKNIIIFWKIYIYEQNKSYTNIQIYIQKPK